MHVILPVIPREWLILSLDPLSVHIAAPVDNTYLLICAHSFVLNHWHLHYGTKLNTVSKKIV